MSIEGSCIHSFLLYLNAVCLLDFNSVERKHSLSSCNSQDSLSSLCDFVTKSNIFVGQTMYELVSVSIFVSLLVSNVYCNQLVRQTANGPIEGIELVSALGQKYYGFRSIRFAEPPITGTDPDTGENVDRRFKVCPLNFCKNQSVQDLLRINAM